MGDAESRFIQWLMEKKTGLKYGLDKNIGDDCAVLKSPKNAKPLVSTDMIVEGVHFDINLIGPRDAGWRGMGAALSDLAACGADPSLGIYVWISIAVPSRLEGKYARNVVQGAVDCAIKYSAVIAGGDYVSTHGPLCIDYAVLGYSKNPLLRSNVKSGDLVAVTGYLGGAGFGLAALKNKIIGKSSNKAIRRYKRPEPRLAFGAALAKTGIAFGCMDISDGLARDAGHLARMSQVNIEIETEAIPIFPSDPSINYEGISPLDMAIGFGDDYELLFSFRSKHAKLIQEIAHRTNTKISIIGKANKGKPKVIFLNAGKPWALKLKGWGHGMSQNVR